MSYRLDLDEYTERALRGELERRSEARKKGLCDYCGRKPDTTPCKFPERHCDHTVCFVCGVEKVPPDSDLVCSAACAKQVKQRPPKEGRVPIEERPKTGEVWQLHDFEVEITLVDEYGRNFNYVRMENGERKFGSIGQTDLHDKRAKKLRDAT